MDYVGGLDKRKGLVYALPVVALTDEGVNASVRAFAKGEYKMSHAVEESLLDPEQWAITVRFVDTPNYATKRLRVVAEHKAYCRRHSTISKSFVTERDTTSANARTILGRDKLSVRLAHNINRYYKACI